ncbi:P-loop containing nucleoside triphosphate hydrolase protein [Favolaschia claudopus]|uniref:P-loop containing nucleoside triphosphate hydrolase protein n=1 Tax=Favolaschia claudopus TaxID=2862362 RepID=A0AAW0CIE0_9AGAR
MLITMATNQFPHLFPAFFDNYIVTMKVQEETYSVALFDIAGGADYDRLRPLCYPHTDVFLVCFRVDNPDSFLHMRDKWLPEIRHYCPDAPFIIVGTQIDTREKDPGVAAENVPTITPEDGRRLAFELGAAKYVECSALTREGLLNVFQEAIFTSLKFPVAKNPETLLQRRLRCIVV